MKFGLSLSENEGIQLTCTKGSSIKYVRKVYGKTNFSDPLIRTRTFAYQGVRKVQKILQTYEMNDSLL